MFLVLLGIDPTETLIQGVFAKIDVRNVISSHTDDSKKNVLSS